MKVESLRLTNFKCYESLFLDGFGSVNVFVGHNNGGKSTLLQAIQATQEGMAPGPDSIRARQVEGQIQIEFLDVPAIDRMWADPASTLSVRIRLDSSGTTAVTMQPAGRDAVTGQFPAVAPHHVVLPLTTRRPAAYSEDVNIGASERVQPDWQNLAAWIDRATSPGHPLGEDLMKLSAELFGSRITAVPSQRGKLVGTYLDADTTIPIGHMGSGVASGMPLLTGLRLSEDKVILIEEPETDLHPAALRRLLEVVEEASVKNQIFVTTHSGQVVEHLGSLGGSQLYEVGFNSELPIPTASVDLVDDTSAARAAVLANLGTRMSDVGLYDAWLILEESSAERIIRDLIVPWFAPSLTGRLGTVSAGGVDNARASFIAYHRLFLYLHLEASYSERGWVVLDGDEPGKKVISRLQDEFSSWPSPHFTNWSQPNFEAYYPDHFQDAVAALEGVSKAERRERKRVLIQAVVEWALGNPDDGRRQLEESAQEIIGFIRHIADSLEKSEQV